MSISFIHTADIHLGLENYSKINPDNGLSQRLVDYLNSLDVLVPTALEQTVDFMVLAGDIYKTPNPNSTVRREFTRVLKKLQNQKIPVVIVLGNHDQVNAFGKAHAFSVFNILELDNLYIVDTPRLLRLEAKSGPVQLLCQPWPLRSHYFSDGEAYPCQTEDFQAELVKRVERRIGELAEAADPGCPLLFFGHLLIRGARFSGSEGMLSLGKDPVVDKSVLNNQRFSYVGLGHLHDFQELNHGESPPIVYSGSLNRIDFQDKGSAKGFVLGQIERSELKLQFKEVPDRPFLAIEIAVDTLAEPTAEFIRQLAEYDLSDAVVKISYTVAEGVSALLNWREIHQALQGCYYLVSIMPSRQPGSRTLRLEVNEDFTVEKAFAEYLKINSALSGDAQKLNRLLKELIREAKPL